MGTWELGQYKGYVGGVTINRFTTWSDESVYGVGLDGGVYLLGGSVLRVHGWVVHVADELWVCAEWPGSD